MPDKQQHADADAEQAFAELLRPFADHALIRHRLLIVLDALPREVTTDFLHDPLFHVAMDDFIPGRGRKVWMPSPGRDRSRCVVLKSRLSECSEAFACYIIAHELAHAYLHNGGWGEISDPELAADALAADWGFPKPNTWR
jgi:hypothetical protein